MCISFTSVIYKLNTIQSSVYVSWCHHDYCGKTCTHMHMHIGKPAKELLMAICVHGRGHTIMTLVFKVSNR